MSSRKRLRRSCSWPRWRRSRSCSRWCCPGTRSRASRRARSSRPTCRRSASSRSSRPRSCSSRSRCCSSSGRARSRRRSTCPGGDGVAITLAGGWAVLLLVWRMFDKPDIQGAGATMGIQWGMFGALLAAGALIAAGARVRAVHAPEPPNPAADDDGLGRAAAAPRARPPARPPPARRDRGHRDAARPAGVGREDDAAGRRYDRTPPDPARGAHRAPLRRLLARQDHAPAGRSVGGADPPRAARREDTAAALGRRTRPR